MTDSCAQATPAASVLLPTIFMIAMTVFGGMIFNVAPIKLSRVALYVQLFITLLYFGRALIQVHLGAAAAFAGLFAVIIWSHLHFAQLSGSAANINGLASFLPLVSFIVFSETRASLPRMLHALAIVSLVYCAVYVLGHGLLLAANKVGGAGVLAAASGRSERLFLLGAWAAYAVYYAWCSKQAPVALRLALAGFGLAAIWMAGSRMFQLVFLVYALFLLLGWTGIAVRIGTFVGFMAITLVMLSGIVIPGFNPYVLLEWDQSAAYRLVEYARATEAIRNHALLGIGLPLDMPSLVSFLRIPRHDLFFASDLGITSMLMMFGVPGLIVAVALVYFCTVHTVATYRDPELAALQVTCMMMAALAWFSPMLFIEPAAMFLGLLIALRMRAAREARLLTGHFHSPSRVVDGAMFQS